MSKQKQACTFNDNNLKLGFTSGELTNSDIRPQTTVGAVHRNLAAKEIQEDLAIVSKEVN